MTMLTTAENFAAAHCLTEWPDYMNYDELLTAISDQHHDVIVWAPFEDLLPEDLIDHIEALRADFIATTAAQASKMADLLDIAITYIDAIADKDSETLAYLIEQYEEATK